MNFGWDKGETGCGYSAREGRRLHFPETRIGLEYRRAPLDHGTGAQLSSIA